MGLEPTIWEDGQEETPMLQKTFQRCFPYNKLLSRIANEREAPGPSPKSGLNSCGAKGCSF